MLLLHKEEKEEKYDKCLWYENDKISTRNWFDQMNDI